MRLILWTATVAAFVALVSITDFRFRDPDSQLYSALGQDLAAKPSAQWIAPQLNGHWNKQGPFLAHPPLALWVTASLNRLGAPAEQSAAIANFLYYLLIFFFVHRIGSLRAPGLAWAMVWAAFFIPVTQQYLIRGNLEPPLTAATLGGMYAFFRAGDSWPARFGFAAAMLAAVFFKGLQGAIVPLFAATYWIVWSRDRIRLLTLLGAIAAVVAIVLMHEWSYRAATGTGFWLAYAQGQAGISVWSHRPTAKLYNLVWYLGRALWFAAPWSLALLAWRRARRPDAPGHRSLFAWLLVSAASLILIMALFDRKADRYIFPAYSLLAMAGGWLVWESSARVRDLLDRAGTRMPYLFAAALLLASVGSIIAATNFYSMVQIWRQ